LITGPNLSILFDTYFIYTYLREIEVGNSRFPRRQDVVWYLICVSLGIIVSPGSHTRTLYSLAFPFLHLTSARIVLLQLLRFLK
jgi:Derlin-2/3